MASLYKDFGKTANDLLTKDFPSAHKVQVETRSADGVDFTVSASKNADGSLFTSFSDKYKFACCGGTEVKATLDSKNTVRGDVTVNTVFPGMKGLFSIFGGSKNAVNAGFEYKQPRFSLTGAANYPLGADPSLASSLVLAVNDKVALGGSCDFALGENPEVKKINTSAAYDTRSQNFLVGASFTGDANTVNVSVAQKVAAIQGSVAAKVDYDVAKGGFGVSAVVSRSLTPNSTFKAKANDAGVVGLSYVNNLDAYTKFNMGAQFSVVDMQKQPDFSISLTSTF